MSYILNRLRSDIRSLNLTIATLTSPYNAAGPAPATFNNRPRARFFGGRFNPLSFRTVQPFAPRFVGFIPFPVQPRAVRFWLPPPPPATIQVIQPVIGLLTPAPVITNANTSNAAVTIGGNNYGNITINQGNTTVGGAVVVATPGTGGTAPTTTTSTTRAITTETIVRQTPQLVRNQRVLGTLTTRANNADTVAANARDRANNAQAVANDKVAAVANLQASGASRREVNAARRAATAAQNAARRIDAQADRAENRATRLDNAVARQQNRVDGIIAKNTTVRTSVLVSNTVTTTV